MQCTALISSVAFEGRLLESEMAQRSPCTGNPVQDLFPFVAFFQSSLVALHPAHMPAMSSGLGMCVQDCVRGGVKPITVGNSCLAGN